MASNVLPCSGLLDAFIRAVEKGMRDFNNLCQFGVGRCAERLDFGVWFFTPPLGLAIFIPLKDHL